MLSRKNQIWTLLKSSLHYSVIVDNDKKLGKTVVFKFSIQIRGELLHHILQDLNALRTLDVFW